MPQEKVSLRNNPITIIAVIKDTEIIDECNFQEATPTACLAMAQDFLNQGHWPEADSVKIMPSKDTEEIYNPVGSYNIGDYLINDSYTKAEHIAILDSDNYVIETRKRPKTAFTVLSDENEVVVKGEVPEVGAFYNGSEFVPPDASELSERRIAKRVYDLMQNDKSLVENR